METKDKNLLMKKKKKNDWNKGNIDDWDSKECKLTIKALIEFGEKCIKREVKSLFLKKVKVQQMLKYSSLLVSLNYKLSKI